MSLRTRVTVVVAMSFVLLLGVRLASEMIRERLLYDQVRDTAVAAQKALWEEIISVEILATKASLIRLIEATPELLRTGRSWHGIADIEAIALVDENQQVRLSYGSVQMERLLNAGTLDAVQNGASESGIRQIDYKQTLLIIAQPVVIDGIRYALVAAKRLDNALQKYAARTHSSAHLLSLSGTLQNSSDPAAWNTYLPDVSTRVAGHQELEQQGRIYTITSSPLTDIARGNGGTLVSIADVTAKEDFTRTLRNSAFVLELGVGLLGLLILNISIWRSFRPLRAAMNTLKALSIQGGEETTHDRHRANDEVSRISLAINALRRQTLQLNAYNMHRERMRLRQEHIIRHELQTLADAIDVTSRQEVLSLLNGENDASPSEEPLLRLVRVLASLRQRLVEQHLRLSTMVANLRDALLSKTKLIGLEQELRIASTVQTSMLPSIAIQDPRLNLHACIIPAQEVGGDFYDYAMLDDHHLFVVIADVSGKGIPAALFMAISRTLLKAMSMFIATPKACISRLNDLLVAENSQMLFVTLFYCIIDLRTGVMEFVNAGHNSPYLLRHSGALERVPGTYGPAVGIMPGIDYEQGRLLLEPGDTLYLYTDGVTEAFDPQRNLYSDKRLEGLLSQMPAFSSLKDISDRVIEDVRCFEQGMRQTDDITSVCIRYISDTVR